MRPEGLAFYVTDINTPSAVAVYRAAKLNGSGYFYTTNVAEYNTVGQYNMRPEGLAFYVMPANSNLYGEIPVYRGAHLVNEGYIYTSSPDEYNSALPANNYRQEGEAFRVFADGSAVVPPTPPTPPTPPGPPAPNQYTITYKAGAGTGNDHVETYYDVDPEYASTFTMTGFTASTGTTFVKYCKNGYTCGAGNEYMPGASLGILSANIELTAIYKYNTPTTFVGTPAADNASNDGSIAGVTNDYEYNTDNGNTWLTTSTGSITGILSTGATYYIRHVAASGILASTPQTVAVAASTILAPGRISVNNVDFYAEPINFAGGDLIIKQDPSTAAFSSTSYSDYIIKIGGVTCTTTGQGYKAGTPNKIGCVIPKTGLTSGNIYKVTVAVNGSGKGDEEVGELNYQALPDAFSTGCGTMQAFGANAVSTCKALLPQGQSILLQDTRGGADIGYGAGNYRVKKMPDGNVWQIDNLAYTPTSSDFPSTAPQKVTCSTYPTTTCTSSTDNVPQWTDGAYVTGSGAYSGADPSYGYLYNWCAATADTSAGCADSLAEDGTAGKEGMTMSLAPTGWKLPLGTNAGTDKSFYKLATAMKAEAATNPVYNADNPLSNYGQQNWYENSPFQGVYSGYYGSGLHDQGIVGYYWSSTAYSGNDAWYLYFYSSGVDPGGDTTDKKYAFPVRAVL